MDQDELIEAAAILLSIDMPIEVKAHLWRELYRPILSMNWGLGEERGVGKETGLFRKTFFGF